jgi:predicted RNA-binding protein with PUA-like domain
LVGPAKWCPSVADMTPGLIPTSITRTPGRITSVRRRSAQAGLESLAMNWLFKEEPSNYDYDALARDGKTSWTGVRNPVAQRNLRAIKKGDKIFFYHTGNEKAVIGICRAAGDAYADPADKTGKLFAVDVEPVKKLKSPVTLAAIKADARFATFVLTRVPRLSVMPVSDEEWKRILEMSEKTS